MNRHVVKIRWDRIENRGRTLPNDVKDNNRNGGTTLEVNNTINSVSLGHLFQLT